ncbi:inovirus Gp2 family protein [Burkholderia pseudomallei]|nr:inovirus Gp2 family protein [Burkholderia pseudomallei]
MTNISRNPGNRRDRATTEKWLLEYAVNSAKKSDKRRTYDGPDARAEDAATIAQSVWRIINSDDVLFSVIRKREGSPGSLNRVKLVPTTLGAAFLRCLLADVEYIAMADPIDQANPFIGLFKQVIARNAEADAAAGILHQPVRYELRYWTKIRRCLTDDELWIYESGLNEAVEEIRERGRARSFADTLKPYTRLAAKNYGSLLELIRALFRKHHRLLVIRVDFEYGKAHRSVSFSKVRKHGEALVRYLKRVQHRKRNVYKGYVLKLEYGLQRGWHFHGLIFLDGDVVHGDVHYGKMFGEHWKTTTTKGMGAYYNCNANAQKYGKDCGIGIVESDNVGRRYALETHVAGYLTKPDFYAPMMKVEGKRLFFRSEVPKTPAVKRGRKRTMPDVVPVLDKMPLPFKARRRCGNLLPKIRKPDSNETEWVAYRYPWESLAQV